MNLTSRILIGMGLGLLLGVFLQWLSLPADHFVSRVFTYGIIEAGGDLFIKLLKMMVVPLAPPAKWAVSAGKPLVCTCSPQRLR